MPLITLYLDDTKLTAEQKQGIDRATPKLREIVANTLSHPETGVFPADEVSVTIFYMDTVPPGGFAEDGDLIEYMECDLQLVVRSNKYPWRMERRDKLAQEIMDAWSEHLPPGLTAWVWLQLLDAGFAKRRV